MLRGSLYSKIIVVFRAMRCSKRALWSKSRKRYALYYYGRMSMQQMCYPTRRYEVQDLGVSPHV